MQKVVGSSPISRFRDVPALQLSSGGTTGLIHRLQRAGHVSRHANPRDRRSAVVRLTPAIADWTAEAWAPFVAEIDALVAELSDTDRDIVRRFIQSAAEAAERHADRLARDADATAQDALAVPLTGAVGVGILVE
jgi:hypothetical protein